MRARAENGASSRDRVSRRWFLARCASGAGAAVAFPGARTLAAPIAESTRCGRGRPFRTSLSVSPFTEGVLDSLVLTDGLFTARTVKEVQQLFVRHGATEVYARIATRKHDVQTGAAMGYARGIERARLARALGLPFNPELGLWATYGDATGQPAPDFSDYPSIRLPGPWHTLTLEHMTGALRQYGELVARQILATGVEVNYWDLGNEVEFGIAGVATRPLSGGSYQAPDKVNPAIGKMSTIQLIGMSEPDRIAWLAKDLWPYVGRLLAATAAGIRSVHRSARFSTHISAIFENTAAVTLAFWHAMKHAGYDPELFGTSFYPTSGAVGGQGNRYDWLKHTAAAVQQRFRKQLFIAEMGYPSGHMPPPYPYNTPLPGYPQDEAGQHAFIRDLVAWGASSGRLAGVRPWAPDLCTPSSHWAPMSFFTAGTHRARPKTVLGSIGQGLARC